MRPHHLACGLLEQCTCTAVGLQLMQAHDSAAAQSVEARIGGLNSLELTAHILCHCTHSPQGQPHHHHLFHVIHLNHTSCPVSRPSTLVVCLYTKVSIPPY